MRRAGDLRRGAFRLSHAKGQGRYTVPTDDGQTMFRGRMQVYGLSCQPLTSPQQELRLHWASKAGQGQLTE